MSDTQDPGLDPVFVNSRRESVVLLLGFTVFFIWTITVSYWLGYRDNQETIGQTIVGIPMWVFWGVALPWGGANLFTFWFCLFYMSDDPLGQALDESDESQTGRIGNAGSNEVNSEGDFESGDSRS